MYCSLIKRDFYFSVPPITKEYNNDDVVYQCVSLVHAKKIGYCFHPVYFYFRRNSSMVNNLHCSSKMINIFNAVEYILSHNSSIKNDYVLFLNFRFLIVNISARFVYADYCIYLLKKFWGLFGENLYIKQQKDFFKKAQLYVSLPNTPIPNLIYINGFDGNNLQEKISYVVERAFYEYCKVVVLDEGTCDVKEFPLSEKA